MFMKLAANQKQSGLNGLRRNLKKKKKKACLMYWVNLGATHGSV